MRRGFSLLELVVAIAILTVGMLGVLRAIQQSMNASRQAAERTQAVELCEQKLAELMLDPELEPGEEDGDFGDEYPRFRWAATTEETELEGLLRMTVEVTWTVGAQSHSVDLETCYAPEVLADETQQADPAGAAGETPSEELPAGDPAAGGLPPGLPGGAAPSP